MCAAFQVYDGLMQQLQTLSDKHAALLAQQRPTEDLATHDSDLARLRSQLGEAKAKANVSADKLTAAQETCRYASMHASLDTVCLGIHVPLS